MKITKHTVPSVTYSLKIDNELIEETNKDNPLVFLVGVGGMIPGFERQLEGLEAGQSYSFEVEPAEGYGEVDPSAIVSIPKEIFVTDGEVNQSLVVGNTIPMQDNQGHRLDGVVLEIGEEEVKMDFNHKLAGKTLNFSGEVLDVRSATEDEISHGHAHGPGGHQH